MRIFEQITYLPNPVRVVPVPEKIVLLLEGIQTSPINADQIEAWTSHDPILSQGKKLVLLQWVDTNDLNIHPYQRKQVDSSLSKNQALIS